MQKIKLFIETDKGKDFLVVVIIILVGLGSFGLGRLSKENADTGIRIEYGGQEEAVVDFSKKSLPGNFFASNRGSKYYSLGCSSGKTIKEENRVYFKTVKEAETAGYELSSSCR